MTDQLLPDRLNGMDTAPGITLLPCPFCGSRAFFGYNKEENFDYVECSGADCHASITRRRGHATEPQTENLTARWNRRSGVESTAPGITDEETIELAAEAEFNAIATVVQKRCGGKVLPWADQDESDREERRVGLRAAMRAVASRTRPATPAPDAMAVTDAETQRVIDEADERFPAGPYAKQFSADALRHIFLAGRR